MTKLSPRGLSLSETGGVGGAQLTASHLVWWSWTRHAWINPIKSALAPPPNTHPQWPLPPGRCHVLVSGRGHAARWHSAGPRGELMMNCSLLVLSAMIIINTPHLSKPPPSLWREWGGCSVAPSESPASSLIADWEPRGPGLNKHWWKSLKIIEKKQLLWIWLLLFLLFYFYYSQMMMCCTCRLGY